MNELLDYVFNQLSDDTFERLFCVNNGVIETTELCDMLLCLVACSLAISLNKITVRLRKSGTFD